MNPTDLLAQASSLLAQGDAEQAERHCRSVLMAASIEDPARPLTTPLQRADAHRILANALRDRGSYADVLNHGKQAEELYRSMGDLGPCCGSVAMQGLALLSLGEHAAAMETLERALSLAVEAGDHRRFAQVLCNIGNVHLNLGEITKARDVYTESANRARQMGNDRILASALGNLGLVHRHLGDPPAAIQSLEEALEIDIRDGNRAGQARHLGNLGNAYQEIGDMSRALELYEQALTLHRQLGHRQHESTWLHNLGVLHQTLGDLDVAQHHFEMALVIERELGSYVAETRSTGRLAGVYLARGKHHEAITLLEQAIALMTEHHVPAEAAMWRSNLAHVLTLAGQFNEAQAHLNIAIPELERLDARLQIGTVWHYQGNLLADVRNPSRDLRAALSWIERSLGVFLEINAKKQAADAHQALGELYREQGHWEQVAYHVQAAADIRSAMINEETRLLSQRSYYQRQIEDIRRDQERARVEYLAKESELQRLIDRLVEKNDLLRQISQHITAAKEHTRPQGVEQLEAVIAHIDNSLRSDGTSAVIDKLLSDVHEAFVGRLRKRVPAITEMELRVATLLHRQLTSANIADVLFISKRTVEVHRHNLRKKLGLEASEDIYQVLQQI